MYAVSILSRVARLHVVAHFAECAAGVADPKKVDPTGKRGVDLRHHFRHRGCPATYRRPVGIGTWALAGLLLIVPKVGPFKLVDVKGPTPQTEADYVHSVAISVHQFRRVLRRFTPPPARRATAHHSATTSDGDGARAQVPHDGNDPFHPLPNRDLDTGKVVQPGGYPLTDATYAYLLHALTSQPTVPIPPGIKENIQAYYVNADAPFTTRKNPQRWAQVQKDLATLNGMPTSSIPQPFPTFEDEDTDTE